MKIYTTLNRIRAHHPCTEGWTKLLKHLGKTQADDEPVDFLTILESNGLDDCLWCFQAEPQHDKFYRTIALKFARDVSHLTTDKRVHDCLDAIQRHIEGTATDDELYAASAAAWSAASAAAAADAACAAAWSAARAAAADAACAAAWSAARAAASAAAASAAAASAAAASAAQSEYLLSILS